MQISGIISISGKAGLSKIISQNKNGIIVESLVDGKRFPVQGNQRVSSLEDISIYSYDEDVLLIEIFKKIYTKEEGKSTISHKEDEKILIDYFKEVLPNYDEERVYKSDIRKVIQWYNLLLEKGFLKIEEEKPKAVKPKTTKKAVAKKSTPKKEGTTAKSPKKAKAKKKD